MHVWPLRFRESNDGVVLSNESGAWFRSSPDFVDRYATGRLTAEDESYLLGKGFAFEIPGDLAFTSHAYRWSVRRTAATPSIDYVILVPTLRCNLSCSYCQVSRAAENATGYDWDEETLAATIQFLDGLTTDHVQVEFQGGEPLLRLDLLNAVRDFCRRRFKQSRFVVCSNFQVVDDAIWEFFDAEDTQLSTSIDGDTSTHTRQRTGSEAATTRFLDNLEAFVGKFGVGRVAGGGDIIPRNTLPFWGRGSKGFDVFFWDGKVDASSGTVRSQFAGDEPSTDPLVVAAHLPPVEVGEMVADLAQNDYLEGESVEAAGVVYEMLVDRIAARADIGPALAAARGKKVEDLEFLDIAEGLAAFIRTNFQLADNPLNKFAFEGGGLSESQLAGGLIFYGKGRCSSCHSGPYFSDFQFHAIATPQLGFGKNGFGIDYGRYNSTLMEQDRYRFRTPPLWNVTKTAPYFHSGSVQRLEDAILLHVDPLAGLSPETMTGEQRIQFYDQLKAWSIEPVSGVHLDAHEIADLVAFLALLSFESTEPVVVTD